MSAFLTCPSSTFCKRVNRPSYFPFMTLAAPWHQSTMGKEALHVFRDNAVSAVMQEWSILLLCLLCNLMHWITTFAWVSDVLLFHVIWEVKSLLYWWFMNASLKEVDFFANEMCRQSVQIRLSQRAEQHALHWLTCTTLTYVTNLTLQTIQKNCTANTHVIGVFLCITWECFALWTWRKVSLWYWNQRDPLSCY